MPPSVALCMVALVTLWLFAKDAKRHPKVSAALWIPLIWAFIIGSRPVSRWLGVGTESADGSQQDAMIDKAMFFCLICAGSIVLSRRRTNWHRLFQNNKWLFIYFLYLGISVLWSDDSFVSLKRWIKDFGNVIMVLVILTEEDQEEALRAFFSRCAYLMIPLSVVLIKYYPELSRRYDVWTYRPGFVGITTNKNMFGMTLFVCGLSLLWMLHELCSLRSRRTDKTLLYVYSVLIIMTGWLLHVARSATALVTTLLGYGMLLVLGVQAVRKHVNRLGAYTAGAAVLVVLLQVSGLWSFLLGEFCGLVGRDPTLHGRNEIWQAVLKEDINPLIGVGFYSFWSEERDRRLSQKYYYSLGEAHNGYIETYLNSGLIGLALLAAAIASAATRMKQEVFNGSRFGALRLSFLSLILIYNVTESTLNRLSPVWFTLLLVMLEYRRPLQHELSSRRIYPASLDQGSVSPPTAVAHPRSGGDLSGPRVWRRNTSCLTALQLAPPPRLAGRTCPAKNGSWWKESLRLQAQV